MKIYGVQFFDRSSYLFQLINNKDNVYEWRYIQWRVLSPVPECKQWFELQGMVGVFYDLTHRDLHSAAMEAHFYDTDLDPKHLIE